MKRECVGGKLTNQELRGALICDRAAALCDEEVKGDGKQVRFLELKCGIANLRFEISNLRSSIPRIEQCATYALSFRSPDFGSQATLC